MDESSEEPEINANISTTEISEPVESDVASAITAAVPISEVVTEVTNETITTILDPSTSTGTLVPEISAAETSATHILEEPVIAPFNATEQPTIVIPEQQTILVVETSSADTTPEQRISESIETVAANTSEKPIESENVSDQKISESVDATVASSSTIEQQPQQPSEESATHEQKIFDTAEAPIMASKFPAPPNPKSHPALPRPPSQTAQRPVFHIIAPRNSAPDITTTTRIYRPRHYVAKASIDIRPNIVRQYEPRRYIRIDKPSITTIQRPRKTAPSVVNILQSAATSKIPIRTTAHKPVNIHQLQPGAPIPGPSTSKPPKPATSAPPPTGTTVTLLKPPKSVTPQPLISEKVGKQRKVKQISQRTSEEPAEKRRKPSVDDVGDAPAEGDENEIVEEKVGTPSEQDPNRSARQRDAVDYLEEVKRKFDSKTYNKFLEVMKGFKMKNMDTLGVIRQICYLFSTDTSLIDGFNNFLPQGYDISHDEKLVRIRDPQGLIHNVDITQNPDIQDFPIGEPSTSSAIVPPQQQPQPDSMMPSSSSQLLPPQFSQQQQQQQFPPYSQAHLQQQQIPQQQELSRENAVSFLQGLRERIPPEKYEKFLTIIKENEKMDPEGTALMFQKVAHLFESDENLLLGFSDFLPDIKHWCQLEHIKRQICENTILNKDFYQDLELQFRKYSTKEKFASEPSMAAGSDEGKGLELTNYIPLRTKPINNLIHIVKSAMTDEYVFFNKLREAIDDDKIFDNFIRCLRLYTNSLISRDELFSITAPFFRGLPLLQREFKRIMGYGDGYIQYPIPNHEIVGHGGVDLDMKSELDFTTLKCNGRSYRLLPEKYRHPKCSGRTVLCREVLNDDWAIFPSWQSEETTRVSIKKSSFEEFLHRTEDERFEIDILIQVNTEAMTALERIRRLASLDPKFEVGENYECGSKTFMVRAIRRAYGENGARVLEALKKNPLLVATTVLNRLKIKQREWKNMENAFKLVWEDQSRKYYQKMTDMRIAKVKRSDNKKLKGSYVFSAVQKLFKQRHVEKLRGELEKEQKIHGSYLYLSFPINWRVAYDLQDLLLKFIKRQQSINQDEKQSMKQFIHKVLPMFFDLIPFENNDEDAGNEEEEEGEKKESSIKVKIPVPRKPAIQPRTFYCGDDFLHFIYLYQVVVTRLHKLLIRSQEYIKEEEHKFEVLKMRQKAFKEAEAKLPEWCDSQWDVINGWDAIIPDKRRSSDRYLTYISDMVSLIEGKMPSSTFDENIKSLFDTDAYPVLGLDKFIATMVKLLQTMVQDDKMLTMINKYWPYNYLTEDVNVEKVFAECLEALPRLFNHENAYQIQIYDQKQTILGIKMVIFASPYVSYEKKFKSQEWKVYRRTYRNDVNEVQRQKEKPCRYKSKPLFLMRNLKKGYERLGRLTQQDELYESSTSEESSSEEEGEKKSKKSNSESEYDEEEGESDFEVPYLGQPALLRKDISSEEEEEEESDIEMDADFDGLEKALSSDKKMFVIDRGCQTYESEFESDEDIPLSQLKRMVELAEEEMRELQSGSESGEDNDSEGEDVDEEEEETTAESGGEEEESSQESQATLIRKIAQAKSKKALMVAIPEEDETEEDTEEGEDEDEDEEDEEEEETTNGSGSEEEEDESEEEDKKKGRKNEQIKVVQKMKTREAFKKHNNEKEESAEASSEDDSSSEKSPPPFIPQEPLMLPPGSSRATRPTQIPKLSPKQPTTMRSPSTSVIISQDECRRRINKLTAHQSYKMLKAEFRSARIPPISDTEHDYDDDEIDQFGGMHAGGSEEDRIWWTEKLKLKRDKKSKKQQQLESDSSSEEEEEEFARPQRKQSRRPPPVRKPRKKPGPKKGWKKQALGSPASAVSGTSGPSRKKSTSTETNEKQNQISEAEEEEGVEVRLPAPPRRYSTSDEDEDEIETARGDRGHDGRESPKLDFGDDHIELISDSELAAASRSSERERSTSKISEASTKSKSKNSKEKHPTDFIRTTRSRSRSMSKASQLPGSSKGKSRVSFSDEKKIVKDKSSNNSESSLSEDEEPPKKIQATKPSTSTSNSSSSEDESQPAKPLEKKLLAHDGAVEKENSSKLDEKATQKSRSKTTSISSSKSKSKSPEEEKNKNVDVQMESEGEEENDEEQEEDEEEEQDDEEEDEEPDAILEKELDRRADEIIEKEFSNRDSLPQTKIAIWMSPGLAEACKSNLCRNLILLENKTSPNVMYRMGAQSDARNREKYSNIKRQKFESWLDKRHRRKRSKRRKAASEVPEIDEAQAFIDIHIHPHKVKDSKKPETTVKEKSKSQQQQQSDDEEE